VLRASAETELCCAFLGMDAFGIRRVKALNTDCSRIVKNARIYAFKQHIWNGFTQDRDLSGQWAGD
jgi:hypothetical protein